jgi:uncharacterized protein (TIGR04255 family)
VILPTFPQLELHYNQRKPMVKRGTELPRKLKHDAIVEALVELRFNTPTVTEVFLGRLIEHRNWEGWQQRQLPAYNIPPQFRQIDPNLQFTPIIELAERDGGAALRIGSSVVSYHRRAPYVGWARFKPELERVVESLFASGAKITVKRLGLRYMNALRPNLHNITSIADLDLELVVSQDVISSAVNINFTTDIGRQSACTVRIATKEFIQGAVPEDTTVFVDVDVFTSDSFSTTDISAVNHWVDFAHTQEKNEFFHLFKQSTIDMLRED